MVCTVHNYTGIGLSDGADWVTYAKPLYPPLINSLLVTIDSIKSDFTLHERWSITTECGGNVCARRRHAFKARSHPLSDIAGKRAPHVRAGPSEHCLSAIMRDAWTLTPAAPSESDERESADGRQHDCRHVRGVCRRRRGLRSGSDGGLGGAACGRLHLGGCRRGRGALGRRTYRRRAYVRVGCGAWRVRRVRCHRSR